MVAFQQHTQPFDVVAVGVGDEDALDAVYVDAVGAERIAELFAGHACVYKHAAPAVADICTVAVA